MFAGIGDPILPADHMVNRTKLAATHLALNFIVIVIALAIIISIVIIDQMVKAEPKSLMLKILNLWQWSVPILIVEDRRKK